MSVTAINRQNRILANEIVKFGKEWYEIILSNHAHQFQQIYLQIELYELIMNVLLWNETLLGKEEIKVPQEDFNKVWKVLEVD